MGGAGRVRYRHLRRTVIAVLATIAFLLILALAVRALLEAEPTRRLARSWLVETAAGYGAELEIGDLHWGMLPPGLRLSQVSFMGAGIDAEIDALQVDLGRVWLTERKIELGRVAASGVRLALTGLPQSSGNGQGQVKVRVRQFSLEDLEFEGVDLPGKMALDLHGVRSSWSTEGDESRGFAEVASARLEIGRMEPVDFSLLARFVVDENGFDLSNYRLESTGFELQGRGRIADDGGRLEINGPVDIGWLDGFIRTHGLLDGAARVAAVVDTRAQALIATDVSASHIVVSGFRLDNVQGRLTLVNGSLRGTLTRADFFGGTVRGSYELAEFGGRYPHTAHLEGEGLSLKGFLDHLRIESAGLASNIDLRADGRWNGRSFPAGNGTADLVLQGSTPGLPVAGALDVSLTGEGFLLFDAEDLAIGKSNARWQGALTLGTWRPSWSIAADPADFAEIAFAHHADI